MKHFACALLVCCAFFMMANTILAETDTEYEKALTYYNSGKYKEAVEPLKNYVQTKPEPSAYYRIGYALYKLKKFNEADEYFKMTYLIDPMFSPQQYGLPERPDMTFKEPAESMPEQAAPKPTPSERKQPSQESQTQKAQEPTVTSPEKPSLPEPQMVEPPQREFQPPAGFKSFPVPGKEMQGLPPGVPLGLVASLGIMIYLIACALPIFTSLCLFLIAKKLNVPAPWTAWIPLIQVWTFVSSANKAWWWILLLLIPIVNTIVGIYLWILITENLGKNKWLGLLMLLPVINLVFLGILAFSKTEQPGYTGMGTTTA